MLFINPHTSFFFRHEAQVTSGEGLNAYGALTWGQFFIYQGFNEKAGWMHTSSSVDNIDEYLETIVKKDTGIFYKYGAEERPVTTGTITVPYKTATGMAQKQFTIYRTHHGPIVREADGKWVAIRLMNEPLKALTQSYSRTKTKKLAEFKQVMYLHTNSSNNTVFADAEGNIAYFHANFIPKRNPKFDWSKHYFAYAVENEMGHGLPHGDLVGPGILLMARLQGQDTSRLEKALNACKIPLNNIPHAMVDRTLKIFPLIANVITLRLGLPTRSRPG